jgi:hypothetical protein
LTSRDQRGEDRFQLRDLIHPASGGLKLDWLFVVGLLVLARPERHGKDLLVLVPVMESFCIAYLLVL